MKKLLATAAFCISLCHFQAAQAQSQLPAWSTETRGQTVHAIGHGERDTTFDIYCDTSGNGPAFAHIRVEMPWRPSFESYLKRGNEEFPASFEANGRQTHVQMQWGAIGDNRVEFYVSASAAQASALRDVIRLLTNGSRGSFIVRNVMAGSVAISYNDLHATLPDIYSRCGLGNDNGIL